MMKLVAAAFPAAFCFTSIHDLCTDLTFVLLASVLCVFFFSPLLCFTSHRLLFPKSFVRAKKIAGVFSDSLATARHTIKELDLGNGDAWVGRFPLYISVPSQDYLLIPSPSFLA